MIGSLNHIAIAVPDLDAAIFQYQTVFEALVTPPQDLPEHGVRVAMVHFPNTKIELITPLGDSSPIQNFLLKNPQGGIHHLCYEVPDIVAAKKRLQTAGVEVIGEGTPKLGYQGNPVLFFNPKDALGVLIELEEVRISKIKDRFEIAPISPLHTHKSSVDSLEGVEGVGIRIDVDFKSRTPADNNEGD